MSTKIIINSELPNLLCHVLFRREFVLLAYASSSVVIVLTVFFSFLIELNFLLLSTFFQTLLLDPLNLRGAFLFTHVEITYKWIFPFTSFRTFYVMSFMRFPK